MPLNSTFFKISELLDFLHKETDRKKALKLAVEIASQIIFIIDDSISLKPASDILLDNKILSFPNQKVDAWFNKHPHYPDFKAAFVHFKNENALFESKFYWLNETSTKARISAGVMLTPNWEDSTLTRFSNYKVGIDFFLTNEAKSLLVVLSNQGNLRVLELSCRLTNTQIEVLNKISQAGKSATQELIHTSLWNAFALKEVNKKFFEGIAELFTELFNFLAKTKDREDSKLFANRLIGRLLFIWFLRKKELINESYNYFTADENSDVYYENKLKLLFFEILNTQVESRKTDDKETPYLNGGLFEAHANDWINENIKFPKDWFYRLYEHFNNFNFTTDESTPEYEQVAIDPEMLGRVLENLLAMLNTDTVENARKAKGAFYTPREIVSYMCKESLRQYLYVALNNPAYNDGVDKLLDESDAVFETANSNAKRDLWGKASKDIVIAKVLSALDNLKVLDPACGSGAFPMGMLQILLKSYERLDSRFDPYKIKLGILENNIYGVDIEPMAVEISRLRAWLSLIVDTPLNKTVEPLPNLDFKFVCANSLISLEKSSTLFDDVDTEEELLKEKERLYGEHDHNKAEKIRNKVQELTDKLVSLEVNEATASGRAKQLRSIDFKDTTKPALCFDVFWHFGLKTDLNGGCFDIVIGNPPYVSTKGLKKEEKDILQKEFGFSDDMYNHFFFKGIQLLSKNGNLSFITSKTFWTTQTKQNLRNMLLTKKINYIFDTANPFESAMVDTSVISVQNSSPEGNQVRFLDGGKDLRNYKVYSVAQSIYLNVQNSVIFKPTQENLKIYELYGQKVKELYDKWWDKIKTSKDIEKNKNELKTYCKSLKPGDIALLGCLTEGGQGLATANNGKYIAVRKSTKWAKNIIKERPKKLAKLIREKKISMAGFANTVDYLDSLNEKEIAALFDDLKEKYGRDVFGQGYLYRLIDDDEIADVDALTEDEKKNGISENKKYYVPYDKGDKDGNRWYLETPFAIAWTQKNVRFLKTDTNARYQGYMFYFKEGFCWSDISDTRIRCRLKSNSIHDVTSMSLFSIYKNIPNIYFICIIVSSFTGRYIKNFINNTSHFQINDARQLPIIIPSNEQIFDFEKLFNFAYETKRKLFLNQISENKAQDKLLEIQVNLDKMVEKLYRII
ncbi:MAG: Eco57I restriction-modification methylase domain-containing protein [Endomicrobium sp.]|jgi:hypothetical protein|nr:Eco57I restriction-modification methylase domain-containing protein [Endomicrobium sp.]